MKVSGSGAFPMLIAKEIISHRWAFLTKASGPRDELAFPSCGWMELLSVDNGPQLLNEYLWGPDTEKKAIPQGQGWQPHCDKKN